MSTMAARAAKTRGIRGGHVLGAMLAFFAVIIVADATLIYKALTTFGGVDNPNAYRQGVAYNQRIARDAEQSLIGWQDDIDVVARRSGCACLCAIAAARAVARQEAGQPGSGARRPIASMRRSSSTEVARGPVRGAARQRRTRASWIVDLSAFRAGGAGEPLYQTRRRVWIKP